MEDVHEFKKWDIENVVGFVTHEFPQNSTRTRIVALRCIRHNPWYAFNVLTEFVDAVRDWIYGQLSEEDKPDKRYLYADYILPYVGSMMLIELESTLSNPSEVEELREIQKEHPNSAVDCVLKLRVDDPSKHIAVSKLLKLLKSDNCKGTKEIDHHLALLAIFTCGEYSKSHPFSVRFAKMTGDMRRDILQAMFDAYERLIRCGWPGSKVGLPRAQRAYRPAYVWEPNRVAPLIGALNHAWSLGSEANEQEQWMMDYSRAYLKACDDKNDKERHRLHEGDEGYLVKCGPHLHEKSLAALEKISWRCTSRCWHPNKKDVQFLELCPDHGH